MMLHLFVKQTFENVFRWGFPQPRDGSVPVMQEHVQVAISDRDVLEEVKIVSGTVSGGNPIPVNDEEQDLSSCHHDRPLVEFFLLTVRAAPKIALHLRAQRGVKLGVHRFEVPAVGERLESGALALNRYHPVESCLWTPRGGGDGSPQVVHPTSKLGNVWKGADFYLVGLLPFLSLAIRGLKGRGSNVGVKAVTGSRRVIAATRHLGGHGLPGVAG
jgi:hypothetical protein